MAELRNFSDFGNLLAKNLSRMYFFGPGKESYKNVNFEMSNFSEESYKNVFLLEIARNFYDQEVFEKESYKNFIF